MKIKIIIALLACALSSSLTWAAQPKGRPVKAPEKKEAPPTTAPELALYHFNQARAEKGPKNQAQFQKVISSGLAYITQYPTHAGVSGAILNLAFYGQTIDKKEAALKTSYLSFLKLDVTNLKYKEGISDDVKACIAALDAAIADADVREAPTPANIAAFREKLDELATTPGAARFLVDRERSYTHILALTGNPAKAETYLTTLKDHKDKGVQTMARDELNFFNTLKTPFALKLTDIDGKPVDFEKLRGKVVGLYIWSTANSTSVKKFNGLKPLHAKYAKKGFELVTASYDKEEDRAKVVKAIKENRIQGPVLFDGKGGKGELAAKLNATSAPKLYLFDQKGILQTTVAGSPVTRMTADIPDQSVEPMIKKLLGIK